MTRIAGPLFFVILLHMVFTTPSFPRKSGFIMDFSNLPHNKDIRNIDYADHSRHHNFPLHPCDGIVIESSGEYTIHPTHHKRNCVIPLTIPQGKAALVHFDTDSQFCDKLESIYRISAKVQSAVDKSTVVSYCKKKGGATLPNGKYTIIIPKSDASLQFKIKFMKTQLGCNDNVPAMLIGVPLTLVPTVDRCHLTLPGRTELTINSIEKTKTSEECTKGVRIRQGSHFAKLIFTSPRICEVDDEVLSLGCGSVVMDAHASSIKAIHFTLKKMNERDAILSPSMCELNAFDDYDIVPYMKGFKLTKQ